MDFSYIGLDHVNTNLDILYFLILIVCDHIAFFLGFYCKYPHPSNKQFNSGLSFMVFLSYHGSIKDWIPDYKIVPIPTQAKLLAEHKA